ncbi:cupin domain-containing protein [Bauldia sp.]|uniref:cupin domain-containing protein n=1 Tax=Bauldia sp. TaxID=2575872 RepID=UPI003BA99EEE
MSGRIGLVTTITALAGMSALCVIPVSADEGHRPPPGSNTMLVAPLETAPGLEVIVSDVVIPPNAEVPPHTHPGEEIVYVIEGAAIHREEGQEDRIYRAGEAFVIGKGKVHSPQTTNEPARAIVFRVHPVGAPERMPAE